jgi:hypothetical protein
MNPLDPRRTPIFLSEERIMVFVWAFRNYVSADDLQQLAGQKQNAQLTPELMYSQTYRLEGASVVSHLNLHDLQLIDATMKEILASKLEVSARDLIS